MKSKGGEVGTGVEVGGAGVKVGVEVSVGGTGVSVGVTVDVLVGVKVGVSVGASVGVSARVGAGVAVGDGLGVLVCGGCVGTDADRVDIGVDVSCEATSVEVGEPEPVMDVSTLHPRSGDMASARPITKGKYLLGIIPSPHITMFFGMYPDKPCVSSAARLSISRLTSSDNKMDSQNIKGVRGAQKMCHDCLKRAILVVRLHQGYNPLAFLCESN